MRPPSRFGPAFTRRGSLPEVQAIGPSAKPVRTPAANPPLIAPGAKPAYVHCEITSSNVHERIGRGIPPIEERPAVAGDVQLVLGDRRIGLPGVALGRPANHSAGGRNQHPLSPPVDISG